MSLRAWASLDTPPQVAFCAGTSGGRPQQLLVYKLQYQRRLLTEVVNSTGTSSETHVATEIQALDQKAPYEPVCELKVLASFIPLYAIIPA